MISIPVMREFTIVEIVEGPVQSQDKAHVRLACRTDDGQKIVFWGRTGISMDHIDAVRHDSLPIRIRCGCIGPKKGSHEYHREWWVPEMASMRILTTSPSPVPAEPSILDQFLSDRGVDPHLIPKGDPVRRILNYRGKYRKLTDYLNQSDLKEVNLSFSKLEKVLGFNLPPSARTYRPWWGNCLQSPQAQSWLIAGYEVADVHVSDNGHVTFKIADS